MRDNERPTFSKPHLSHDDDDDDGDDDNDDDCDFYGDASDTGRSSHCLDICMQRMDEASGDEKKSIHDQRY